MAAAGRAAPGRGELGACWRRLSFQGLRRRDDRGRAGLPVWTCGGGCRVAVGSPVAAGRRVRVSGRAPAGVVPGCAVRRPLLVAVWRPSMPADVVAPVLVLHVLQALQGLSDREAVEALTFG